MEYWLLNEGKSSNMTDEDYIQKLHLIDFRWPTHRNVNDMCEIGYQELNEFRPSRDIVKLVKDTTHLADGLAHNANIVDY